AVPGFAHRRVAHFVARALVSFPDTARWFPEGRVEVAGMPVRKEFFEVKPKALESPVTVLITGGSQGSRTLNRAVEQSWPLWRKGEVRLIHQTGRDAFDEVSKRFCDTGVEGEVAPFVDNMPTMLAQADLVLCRSGMGTVSELA